MDNELAHQTCIPCRGGVPPLTPAEIAPLRELLGGDWEVIGDHHLRKTFTHEGFPQALEFVNRVGAVAEEQGHHPDLHLSFRKVTLEIFTHKIDGLSKSDFILAARIDAL